MIQSMLMLRVARKAGLTLVLRSHKWSRNSTSCFYKNEQLDAKLELVGFIKMLS
jgi:hypothetical protein